MEQKLSRTDYCVFFLPPAKKLKTQNENRGRVDNLLSNLSNAPRGF